MKIPIQQTPAPFRTAHHDQFFKTKMCPFLLNNVCSRGENCSYAHSEDEIRPITDLSKTQLCCEWKNKGGCRIPNCRYAHGHQELRHTCDYFKTAICVHWQQGKCPLNENCRHAHGNYEIKQRVYRWTEKDKDKLKKKSQPIQNFSPCSKKFSTETPKTSNYTLSPYSSISANSSVLNIMSHPNEDRVVVESTYTNIPISLNWNSAKYNDQMKSNKSMQTLIERPNKISFHNPNHDPIFDQLAGNHSQITNNQNFKETDDNSSFSMNHLVENLFKSSNDLRTRNYRHSDYNNSRNDLNFADKLFSSQSQNINSPFSSSLFALSHDEANSTNFPFTPKSSSESSSFFFPQDDDPQAKLLSLMNSNTQTPSISSIHNNTEECDINTTSTPSSFFESPFDNCPQNPSELSNHDLQKFRFNSLNAYLGENSTYNSDFPSNLFYNVGAMNFSNSFNNQIFLE